MAEEQVVAPDVSQADMDKALESRAQAAKPAHPEAEVTPPENVPEPAPVAQAALVIDPALATRAKAFGYTDEEMSSIGPERLAGEVGRLEARHEEALRASAPAPVKPPIAPLPAPEKEDEALAAAAIEAGVPEAFVRATLEARALLRAQQQQQGAVAQEQVFAEVDRAFDSLSGEFGGAFGHGRGHKMDKGSSEFKARAQVFRVAAALREADGETAKPLAEYIKDAASLKLADKRTPARPAVTTLARGTNRAASGSPESNRKEALDILRTAGFR